MSNGMLRIANREISYEQAKDMLFPELIPQKGNEAILSNLPHTVQIQAEALKASSKRYKHREDAEKVMQKCQEEHQVSVKSVQTKEKTEKPPLLYSKRGGLLTMIRSRLFSYDSLYCWPFYYLP